MVPSIVVHFLLSLDVNALPVLVSLLVETPDPRVSSGFHLSICLYDSF